MEVTAPNGSERQLLTSVHLSALQEQLTLIDDVIVVKAPSGQIQAIRNRCRHAGGRLRAHQGQDQSLVCPRHGWQLNLTTMTYQVPAGGLPHACLDVDIQPDGRVLIFDTHAAQPWLESPRPAQTLTAGEFTLRFYTHACVELICGQRRLFTDPWLMGPAFSRGWWLLHEPPTDWRERLATADAIYISHNHSDHLNLWTLRELARRNPRVPVYVPAFQSTSCQDLVRRAGMTDVRVTPCSTWVALDADTRFMLLPDAAGRNDSGLLVDYKGHLLVNNVDCANLANGDLPAPVDVLLCQFTSGACEYPVCFGEQYGPAEIADRIARRNANMLDRGATLAKRTQAALVIPFAGYFTEAHPADSEIQRDNVKQSPQRLQEHLAAVCPQAKVWLPESGAVLDLATHEVTASTSSGGLAQGWDFEPFLTPMRAAMDFAPLYTMEGIQAYFAWAGFRDVDLVLRVVEMTETFDQVLREFYVDFLDLSFPTARPSRPHRFLQMKVRADVFRYVLKEGLPWEEISIGFQGRFCRDPDSYNFDLWDYFQNNLPSGRPEWNVLANLEGAVHVHR